jgi:hypothetical protein
MNGNDLERALMETVEKANLSELTTSATDTAMEAAGYLPVVGLLQKLWKAAWSIPTYLFMKKMIRFLAELKDIPPEERQSQIAKLEVVPGEKEKVGEAILLLLDRLNDMRKPAMAGRAFKAYLEGRILREQLDSLNYAIDRLDVSTVPTIDQLYRVPPGAAAVLPGIMNRYSIAECNYHNLQHLAIVGLLDIQFTEVDTTARVGDGFKRKSPAGGFSRNALGELFFKVVLW